MAHTPTLGPGALGSAFKKKASRPARGPPMAAKSALACLLTKAKPWRHLLGPGDRKQPHHSAITAPKCPRDLKFFSPSANISCGACLRRPCGAAKQALRSQPPALSRGPYPLGPGLLPPLCKLRTARENARLEIGSQRGRNSHQIGVLGIYDLQGLSYGRTELLVADMRLLEPDPSGDQVWER